MTGNHCAVIMKYPGRIVKRTHKPKVIRILLQVNLIYCDTTLGVAGNGETVTGIAVSGLVHPPYVVVT